MAPPSGSTAVALNWNGEVHGPASGDAEAVTTGGVADAGAPDSGPANRTAVATMKRFLRLRCPIIDLLWLETRRVTWEGSPARRGQPRSPAVASSTARQTSSHDS